MEITKDHWRKCSACKKNLPYSTKYYECSVSSCSRKRTGYVFCCVLCWETHVPGAGHRDAGAIEKKSPSYDEWIKETSSDVNQASMPKRILVNPQNRVQIAVQITLQLAGGPVWKMKSWWWFQK